MGDILSIFYNNHFEDFVQYSTLNLLTAHETTIEKRTMATDGNQEMIVQPYESNMCQQDGTTLEETNANVIASAATENRIGKCRTNWIWTNNCDQASALREGLQKMKTRRSMNTILKDISNTKCKLRTIPKSPAGEPVRLRLTPDTNSELYNALRRRYAAMHSPDSK